MIEQTKTTISQFVKDESGPTAVEYGVMLALVALVCSASVLSLGSATAQSYSDSSTRLAASMSESSGSGSSASSGSLPQGKGFNVPSFQAKSSKNKKKNKKNKKNKSL